MRKTAVFFTAASGKWRDRYRGMRLKYTPEAAARRTQLGSFFNGEKFIPVAVSNSTEECGFFFSPLLPSAMWALSTLAGYTAEERAPVVFLLDDACSGRI